MQGGIRLIYITTQNTSQRGETYDMFSSFLFYSYCDVRIIYFHGLNAICRTYFMDRIGLFIP